MRCYVAQGRKHLRKAERAAQTGEDAARAVDGTAVAEATAGNAAADPRGLRPANAASDADTCSRGMRTQCTSGAVHLRSVARSTAPCPSVWQVMLVGAPTFVGSSLTPAVVSTSACSSVLCLEGSAYSRQSWSASVATRSTFVHETDHRLRSDNAAVPLRHAMSSSLSVKFEEPEDVVAKREAQSRPMSGMSTPGGGPSSSPPLSRSATPPVKGLSQVRACVKAHAGQDLHTQMCH